MNENESHESILKDVGLKSTAPRLRLLAWFLNHPCQHVSAEALAQKLAASGDEVAVATLYRVLAQFEEAGLVEKHVFEGGACVYEYNTGKHHDHLMCTHCGRVEEFVDHLIEQRQSALMKERGFVLTEHTHILYGLCPECQKI